jgi:hypothetical protein
MRVTLSSPHQLGPQKSCEQTPLAVKLSYIMKYSIKALVRGAPD